MTAGLLSGRRILITGASRGIGAAIAREVVENGAEVALLARDVERLHAVRDDLARCASGKVLVVSADLTSTAAIRSAVDQAARGLGGLDGLVNNAGMNRPMKLFLEVSDAEFRRIVEVNLMGAIECVRQVLPRLLEQGGGSIVNVASMAAKMAVPAWAAYCTAKHGLLGFSKVIAHEYAEHNVRCNTVCPGFVDTALLAEPVLDEWADSFGMTRREIIREVIVKRAPQRRYVQAASVAKAVVFLLSSAAEDVTGQSLNVSAGIGDY